MKIIQTFWSSGRNPLEHSFGWPHAEYNLMSWTLSCLSLREHFDQVELYTDKRGYHGISHYRNCIWSKLKYWHLNDNINWTKAEEKDEEKSKDETSWSAPYTIKLDIHNVYTDRTVAPRREDRPDENLNISDVEYIIPSIYHEEFSL